MAQRPADSKLARSYKRLGSVPAVAGELGVAYETARRWLLSAGVELHPKGRPSKRADVLDMREISTRYKDGESVATIGLALGVSPATIRARLIDAGIPLRSRRGWKY